MSQFPNILNFWDNWWSNMQVARGLGFKSLHLQLFLFRCMSFPCVCVSQCASRGTWGRVLDSLILLLGPFFNSLRFGNNWWSRDQVVGGLGFKSLHLQLFPSSFCVCVFVSPRSNWGCTWERVLNSLIYIVSFTCKLGCTWERVWIA